MDTTYRVTFGLAAVLLACGAARAESVDRWGRFAPEDIVSIAVGDWNQDGMSDAALLVLPSNADADAGVDADPQAAADAEGSTLYILLRGYEDQQPFEKLFPALRVPDAAWPSPPILSGQVPELIALPNGSLQLVTMNFAVGRNAWEQKLTLAWRDETFVVAGFTYRSTDKISNEEVDCDINLLSGSGFLNGATIAVTASETAFDDWDYETGYALCGLG